VSATTTSGRQRRRSSAYCYLRHRWEVTAVLRPHRGFVAACVRGMSSGDMSQHSALLMCSCRRRRHRRDVSSCSAAGCLEAEVSSADLWYVKYKAHVGIVLSHIYGALSPQLGHEPVCSEPTDAHAVMGSRGNNTGRIRSTQHRPSVPLPWTRNSQVHYRQ